MAGILFLCKSLGANKKLNFEYKTVKDRNITSKNQGIEDLDNNQNKHLVVVLHGILDGYKKVDPLVKAIDNIYQDQATIWVPKLPFGLLSVLEKPEDIIKKLRKDLDEIWKQGQYSSLRIVGHSLGGVYARALMLEGIKHNVLIKFCLDIFKINYLVAIVFLLILGKPSAWAECQDIKLVLLAAVNRGMGISRHMGIVRVILAALGIFLGRLIQIISAGNCEPTIFSGLRGSKFITKMRLNWLIQDHNHPLPCTVQLLGSTDDIVAPQDNIDLATGNNFHYLDVRHTGHNSILQMEYTEKEETETDEEKRGKILQTALEGDPKELDKVRPWELHKVSEAEKEERKKIKHVVFVIHGIRDEGHWTDKIARRIWSRAKEERDSWEKVVDSYGYFGMGQFLIPGVRWQKITWLMEKYLETKAKYPEAKFSYVGHSHGTYVLAKALENYPQCQFENIVFAGSIVRENYNWSQRIESKQVARVLNFVATCDWAVALFPNFLGLYNLQDLGGAGHNGFKQGKDKQNANKIHNIRYAIGGHGAGKEEDLWDTIADFVLMEGDDKLPEDISKFLDKQNKSPNCRAKNETTEDLPLNLPLEHTRSFPIELLGFVNIFFVTLIITLAFVVVPIFIIRWWGIIAGLISLIISLITSFWGLRIIVLLLALFYSI